MNKFLDENNFDDKEANKCVGIHGAIFDVDGTLLDSMVIWEEAAVRYLNSLGLEPEENLSEKIMTMSMEEGEITTVNQPTLMIYLYQRVLYKRGLFLLEGGFLTVKQPYNTAAFPL